MKEFIDKANLDNAYYNKFNDSQRTYMWGTKRLDYILIDPSLTQAVECIGYLGTHEGSDTDHVYAYMDLNDAKSHQGFVHRPINTKSRDFTLTQSDKVKTFTDSLVLAASENTYKERVDKLARSFHEYGPTYDNKQIYQQISNSFIELAEAHTSKVEKRRFGYEQSPELTQRGALFLLHKHILDCKYRNNPTTPSIQRRAHAMGIDPETILSKTSNQIRQETTRLCQELWATQKTCTEARLEWLNKIAQDRA
jgi:hypothetical protein